ncbi:uncharacterized protein LOC143915258 [Arctopsyche grandis]|uniref:uncharacterized protein LOC143915258 n=1 Tax=Arctopsyche grandis TaxID=121162 RepID=UPI00406D781C
MEESISSIRAAEKKEKAYETAVKKQALLIDNLKKQISYMSSQRNIDGAEKQLDSILKFECK